ncbi:MAG TPA: MFS transporter [Stellaceae bacterium]|nr:MFS transporter [Stellaceae bacterium]
MLEGAPIHLETLLSDRRARPFQFKLLALLMVFMFFEGYDMQVLSFAAPVIIKAWHSNKAAFGGVFGGAMAGFMAGALVISNLGDYFGRVKMIIGGSIVFGIFTLLSADAHDLSQLFIWRTIAGIGLGGAVPSAVALISDYWPSSARTTSVALIFGGYTIGSALGGVIAAYLIPRYGWPSVFILGGLAPLVVTVFLLLWLPESLWFLVRTGKRSDRVLKIVNKLQPGAAYTKAPQLLFQEPPGKGIPVSQLFENGRALMTVTLWVSCICITMTLHFMTSWLPTVIADQGIPLSHAIITTSILQTCGTIGGFLTGRLLDRRGVMMVAIVAALGIPCLLLLANFSKTEMLMMLFVGGSGFAIVGSFQGLMGLSGALYPTPMRTASAGWTLGVARLGAIFGPTIGGVLLSFDFTPKMLFEFAVVPILVEVVAILVIARQPSARDFLSALRANGTEPSANPAVPAEASSRHG